MILQNASMGSEDTQSKTSMRINPRALESLWFRCGQHKGRAVLIQWAFGPFLPLLNLTREHHAAYAERHNMSYWCVHGRVQTIRHPYWDKIMLVRTALQMCQFEYVFWLDSDTLIIQQDQDLRDALPSEKWLGMVTHHIPGLVREHQNAGVLYIRDTATALAFFDHVWDNWPLNPNLADRHLEDQTSILDVLSRDSWRDGLALLPDRWNSTLVTNEVPNPVVMAWHGTYKPEARLTAMRRVLNRLSQNQPGLWEVANIIVD